MARIDYNDIKNELKDIIEAYSFTSAPTVSIEGDIIIDGFGPNINIELDSRSPAESQSISAGRRTRYFVSIVLTVSVKNLDKQQAIQVRDDLLSELEYMLLNNRTLNNKVSTSWLQGGNNISAFIEEFSSYIAAGDVKLNLDCSIIT